MTGGARRSPALIPSAGRTTFVTAADGVGLAVHGLGGRGRPVVMAHATGFHGRVWGPVAERLRDDFLCLAPDFRGHGDSAPPPALDFDWRGFASDVLAVVHGLGLQRPLGVGHSSGATALLLAEEAAPGTFDALYCFEPIIVAAAAPLGRDPDSWLAERARRRRADFPSRDEAVRHLTTRPALGNVDPAALDAYVSHGLEELADGTVRLKCTPENEALVYEMATANDCFARLGEVRCPVTLVSGSRSEAIGRWPLEQITARLASVSTELLDGVGHLGPLEDPVAVAGSVARAFTSPEVPTGSKDEGRFA